MTQNSMEDYKNSEHDQLIWAFIEQHREMIASCLDGLSEQEVRLRLVPSKTTLLGLVKHATFVERVWFEEAPTGLSREELGLEARPDESFELSGEDSIASVSKRYSQVLEISRAAVEGKTGRDIFPGNRRGPISLTWIGLHVLRELAQHCGHADILREQILASRAAA